MKPSLFIGSSTEGLETALAAQEELEYDAEVTVWPQNLFEPSGYSVDDLLNALHRFDFAVFIFSPDDTLEKRGVKFSNVRDNVIFELGMFIAKLGRERCFFMLPRNTPNLNIPTDLFGLNPLSFNPNRSDDNIRAALAPSCNKIRKRIKELGLIKKILASSKENLYHPEPITKRQRTIVENKIEKIFDEAIYEKIPASILFIDIDRFNAINKWYGREIGDEVIKIVQKIIKSYFKTDYVKRLGGDQFLVCLKNKTLAQATRIGNSLLKKVTTFHWYELSPNLFATVSIGAAHYKENKDIHDWIVRAIHGSINAKKAGGNRLSKGPVDLPVTVSLNYMKYLS